MSFDATDPWRTIPPDEIPRLQHISDLRPYMTDIPKAHRVAKCVNCRRMKAIQVTGLCDSCYNAARRKTGQTMLDTLRTIRRRLQMGGRNYSKELRAEKAMGRKLPVPKRQPKPGADRCLISGPSFGVSSLAAMIRMCEGPKTPGSHPKEECKACPCGKDLRSGVRQELPVNGYLLTMEGRGVAA